MPPPAEGEEPQRQPPREDLDRPPRAQRGEDARRLEQARRVDAADPAHDGVVRDRQADGRPVQAVPEEHEAPHEDDDHGGEPSDARRVQVVRQWRGGALEAHLDASTLAQLRHVLHPDEPALVQDADAVADSFHLAEHVRGKKHGLAAARRLPQLFQ